MAVSLTKTNTWINIKLKTLNIYRLCPVGESYFETHLAAVIIKAEWHPFSSRHLGMVVKEDDKKDCFM